jgi:large-conductance mechanosensitive channel
MFRKINKDKSISKIVVYSIILTWFAVILVENWQYMRVTWFKEVWDFIDFKAIGNFIESNIPFVLWFVIIFIVIYKSLRFNTKGTLSNEEYDDTVRKHMDDVYSEWDDVKTAPHYHNFPSNMWHKTMAHKNRDL